VEEKNIFQGEWEADQDYKYPFTLATASWPPTYYGTHLNVTHYVEATADLPWKIDPKVKADYLLFATTAPEGLSPTATPVKTNIFGRIILGLILLVCLVPLVMLSAVLVPIVLGIGGAYWFFRVLLPKIVLGKVDCTVEPLNGALGGVLRGQLAFTPRRDLTINGANWTLKCVEACTAGSGTDRVTHKHEVLSQTQALIPAGTLGAGKPVRLDFDYRLPTRAPPSMKFTDNEINWVGEVRIDIPRWPDFVKEFKLIVGPHPDDSAHIIGLSPYVDVEGTDDVDPTSEPEAELAFEEVVDQIQKSQADVDQLSAVIEAVRGLTFQVTADLQGWMFQTTEAQSQHEGQWVSAQYEDEMALSLLWPPGQSPPQGTVYDWSGSVHILEFDVEHQRLLLEVVDLP
jgi:hypothetical protein